MSNPGLRWFRTAGRRGSADLTVLTLWKRTPLVTCRNTQRLSGSLSLSDFYSAYVVALWRRAKLTLLGFRLAQPQRHRSFLMLRPSSWSPPSPRCLPWPPQLLCWTPTQPHANSHLTFNELYNQSKVAINSPQRNRGREMIGRNWDTDRHSREGEGKKKLWHRQVVYQ